MLSNEQKETAAEIGKFYLEKNSNNYENAVKQLESLGLTELVFEKCVTLKVRRPGVLIGQRGKNLEALEKFLGIKIKVVEVPDSIEEFLIPEKPYESGQVIDDFDNDLQPWDDRP